jgi:hypothetical protein
MDRKLTPTQARNLKLMRRDFLEVAERIHQDAILQLETASEELAASGEHPDAVAHHAIAARLERSTAEVLAAAVLAAVPDTRGVDLDGQREQYPRTAALLLDDKLVTVRETDDGPAITLVKVDDVKSWRRRPRA